jgi:predicted dehydrogenase
LFTSGINYVLRVQKVSCRITNITQKRIKKSALRAKKTLLHQCGMIWRFKNSSHIYLPEIIFKFTKETSIMKDLIKWGMIGCGDVTEVKSGPAFSKVPNSRLVAVMSRNPERAADYARRHQIARWYDDALKLIEDPEVNAIYIATPPLSHEELSLAAFEAGKPVYVEKPMALNALASRNMQRAAEETGLKLTVAHYRRQQPVFLKIKSLIDQGAIGTVKQVKLEFVAAALSPEALVDPKTAWRVDPTISGGGLFHDLAPHQLDLMLYFFGEVEQAMGVSANQNTLYAADDLVSGVIKFKNKVIFSGNWNFSASPGEESDRCEIIGSEGRLIFPVFGKPGIELRRNGKQESISFEPLMHVQQPMIEATVRYFLDEGTNPGTGIDGIEVMRLIEQFSNNTNRSAV